MHTPPSSRPDTPLPPLCFHRIAIVGAGAIGGFSSTTEYECRVQPEPFEKALLTHQLTVAQMFGEKMKAPSQ